MTRLAGVLLKNTPNPFWSEFLKQIIISKVYFKGLVNDLVPLQTPTRLEDNKGSVQVLADAQVHAFKPTPAIHTIKDFASGLISLCLV